jgi:hypothetical protein
LPFLQGVRGLAVDVLLLFTFDAVPLLLLQDSLIRQLF